MPVTDETPHPAFGRRLGVYVDAVYASTHQGLSVDPIDAAFLMFVSEVGRPFEGLTVFGRTIRNAGESPSQFVPLPASIELVPLPYYRNLADVRAVFHSAGRTTRTFWRELGRVDVAWAFGPHPLALLFVVLARLRGTKVVLGVRQDTVEYFRSRLTNRRSRLALLPLARFLDLVYRLLARRLPATVVGSQIAGRYGSPRKDVHEMVVSIVRRQDVATATKQQVGHRDRPTQLLTVGRIEPEKTPLVLVDAMQEIERERPGRYRLHWIGHGRLESQVRDRVTQLGLDGIVDLRGYVPFGPDLLAWYREADAFVHVATTEGVPQVLLEAFAASTPIVATDVGGVRSLLGDDEAGLLVAPRDPGALAAAILRLEDPALRLRLTRAGLMRVVSFTLETQADAAARFLAGERP